MKNQLKKLRDLLIKLSWRIKGGELISNNKTIINKIFKLLFSVIGAGLGIIIVAVLEKLDLKILANWNDTITAIVQIIIIISFALIFFILSPKALKSLETLLNRWEDQLKDKSVSELVIGSIGLILGLLIAFLVSQPLFMIPIAGLGSALSVVLYGMLGYLGVKIALKNKDEIVLKIQEIPSAPKKTTKEKTKAPKINGIPKILDTSVIIDGRIRDICQSGFLEGPLVVPVFVLEELQHIADSEDSLKRNRGRRGLDVIKAIQEDKDLEVIIFKGQYEEISEVDSKLLKLTVDLEGKIVTNDYNLNKVAAVQGIEVLNINELANSVKPVYLPGEEMKILIVKPGKEKEQGLGYLDDGTMIVVESGKHHVGETIDVIVTSVLQTSAGKMIFAKPKLN